MARVSEDEQNCDVLVDEIYEFSAPKFFDFTREESIEETLSAELWFDTASAYAPSPFMHRIRAERSYTVESICDFGNTDKIEKFDFPLPSGSTETDNHQPEDVAVPLETRREGEFTVCNEEVAVDSDQVKRDDAPGSKENVIRNLPATATPAVSQGDESHQSEESKEKIKSKELFTPRPALSSTHRNEELQKKSEKQVSAHAKNQSKSRFQSSLLKGGTKTDVKRRIPNLKNTGTPSLDQENQAIKRQKLEEGKSKQIGNPMPLPPQTLPHKCSSKEERKVYARDTPFISRAEMVKRFQSSTKEIHTNNSLPQSKPKLTLTRPKEPEFETSQRLRHVKVKSTADLEEEEMAKIPKFKARPLNKKILEAPSLVIVQRSTPKAPEFREFHLETTTRAHQNSDAEAAAQSADAPHQQQNSQWKPSLTEPKTPLLHTSMRARPPTVKSSMEMEKEELEKVPKFKARPLNKKIFESKGELGVFCNTKKQITVPQEFHFATGERFPPPPTAVADLFDKLSLNSLEQFHGDHASSVPRLTTPVPFHLHTEERGAEKERRFAEELMNKELEEERCRIPKANPYPYTTDYPLVPPKPDSKPCTKPEPFHMESLVRHEKEVERQMGERQRREMEEAEMRLFKAHSVQKEDPMPVHEKVRKPLTEVHQFTLCVDQRANQRAEFDNRVKEKELQYKRYREESEAATMVEEEKAMKQLRRTMIPQARPVPNFGNPFCPQKSNKETTRARSPKLLVTERKQRKRRMLKGVAECSPAYNMR